MGLWELEGIVVVCCGVLCFVAFSFFPFKTKIKRVFYFYFIDFFLKKDANLFFLKGTKYPCGRV